MTLHNHRERGSNPSSGGAETQSFAALVEFSQAYSQCYSRVHRAVNLGDGESPDERDLENATQKLSDQLAELPLSDILSCGQHLLRLSRGNEIEMGALDAVVEECARRGGMGIAFLRELLERRNKWIAGGGQPGRLLVQNCLSALAHRDELPMEYRREFALLLMEMGDDVSGGNLYRFLKWLGEEAAPPLIRSITDICDRMIDNPSLGQDNPLNKALWPRLDALLTAVEKTDFQLPVQVEAQLEKVLARELDVNISRRVVEVLVSLSEDPKAHDRLFANLLTQESPFNLPRLMWGLEKASVDLPLTEEAALKLQQKAEALSTALGRFVGRQRE